MAAFMKLVLGLDDLQLSPVCDSYHVNQPGFDVVAGTEVGYETGVEIDEGCGWILI